MKEHPTVYAIAKRFTLKARRAAAAREYARGTEEWQARGARADVGERRYCPLGVMLATDLALAFPIGSPSAAKVASLLLTRGDCFAATPLALLRDPLFLEARQFIRDWDAGRIDSLADALGLA